MQAIWQVYRFFEKGLSSLHVLFNKEYLTFPSNINFEILAKLFVGTIVDAYPSPEKILRLASQLGLESQIVAQIIIFSQMRDAIRKVAPRLFRSEQHRQDLLLTYMSALDELDDIIESLEDEQEEQRKQQEGNAK